jgi:uncharacterized repeat protein (TIGR03833 family)
MPSHQNRSDIHAGLEVNIVLKQDQGTRQLKRGVVADILTNSPFHPHGIKVRRASGTSAGNYCLRHFMTNEAEFEQLVDEGVKAIPKRFLDLLDNVAIVIDDFPSREQAKKMNLKSPWALFGLYEGVPRTKRGVNYSGVLPDKITIFRQPILQASFDQTTVKEIVKNTVWHEIAHYFGLDHEQIRKAESLKRKKK